MTDASMLERTDPSPAAASQGSDAGIAGLLAAGVAHQQAGRWQNAEACYRRILAAKPDHADALHLMGVLANQLGQHQVAVELIRGAIAVNAQNAPYFSNLAASLHALGDSEGAIAACRDAIRINPDYATGHLNLAVALHGRGAREEAIAAYQEAIRLGAGDAKTHLSLGHALKDGGRFEEAIHAYREAVRREPGFADAHHSLGLALVELGRLPEAKSAIERAVLLEPRNASFLRSLGELTQFVRGDPLLAQLEALAKDAASLPPAHQAALHFTLAKAYADLREHETAFRHLAAGNALHRRQIAYDEPHMLGLTARVETTFSAKLFETRRNVGHPSELPIFIVGMPRSGTSLVEQILASHPAAFGAGERKLLGKILDDVRATSGTAGAFPEMVAAMTGEQLNEVGARYVNDLAKLAPDATRITDKLPSNFLLAGLIHLALPNARIIHVVRDPVDTCMSCYSKLFADGNPFSYDLAELGRYYRHYAALMAHWHCVLPAGRILEVRYEDVVADLEGQARRMLAHCGLAWDAACLAFHRTERPVLTASAAQVREPLHDRSIGRRRPYEPHLAPLLDALNGP
jgi:tetratricopeptide (TPR) repeat protein